MTDSSRCLRSAARSNWARSWAQFMIESSDGCSFWHRRVQSDPVGDNFLPEALVAEGGALELLLSEESTGTIGRLRL